MFKEWLKENDISALLTKREQYHPFPTVGERGAWESIAEAKKTAILTHADEYKGFEWPSLPATAFMAFARTGNRVAYEKNHFERRRALGALVLGECVKADGSYLDDIINGVWCICEESFWGVSAHNGLEPNALPDVENRYIDLFAAETAGLLAFTNYLLGERLKAEAYRVTRRINIELNERIITPFLNRQDFWWMGFTRRVNNWNPWILANLTSVILLAEPDGVRRVHCIEKVLEYLDAFIDVYHDDGGCDEGTSYWNAAGGALFDCLDQLHEASDGNIAFWHVPLIKEIGRFIYRSHIAGSYFINFADGSASVNIDSEMIFRYGRRIDDEKLMKLAAGFRQHIGKRTGDVPQPLRRELPAIFGYETFAAADNVISYERDVWMDGIQVTAARQYEEGERGFYLAAKGGHNAESHNHNDVGSFIVFYNGKPLFIDVGVETYTKKTFSPERYSIWTMQSSYHNLPEINGAQQLPGENYAASGVTYSSDERAASFSLNIEGAYAPEAALVSYNRRFDFRKGENGSVEITDSFAFAKPGNTLAFTFMSHVEPTHVPGYLTLPTAGGTVKLSYDDALCVKTEKCPTTDGRLSAVWGECVYRTVFTATEVGEAAVFKFVITD